MQNTLIFLVCDHTGVISASFEILIYKLHESPLAIKSLHHPVHPPQERVDETSSY